MNAALAIALGYLLGARAGSRDLDRLSRAIKALLATDEFADVATAARVQLASSLRDLAALVDGGAAPEGTGDLVARVRQLVGEA